MYEEARGAFYPTVRSPTSMGYKAHGIDTNTSAKIMFCLN